MLEIKYDDNNYVVGFSTLGGIEGGIEFKGEIPSDFDEFYYSYYLDNNILVKDLSKIKEKVNKEELFNELNSIYEWFFEYDNQVKQYERCSRLGIAFDKDINILDNEAIQKQLRIKEIENILSN